jgi:hypothetical protein
MTWLTLGLKKNMPSSQKLIRPVPVFYFIFGLKKIQIFVLNNRN